MGRAWFGGLVLLVAVAAAAAELGPTGVSGFFPDAEHDDAIPKPEALLGFPVGQRAAKHAEIERAFKTWAEASDRAELAYHGTTHEGRKLFHLIVSSPDNLARAEEIRAGLSRLADPRDLGEDAARELIDSLPATAYMGYSIHGDETSGADGATAVAYHLIADRSETTRELLSNVVIVIDPMMNPDGRDRYLQQIAEHRSEQPNFDDQALIHRGYWPAGRTNHYYFDLNRDWIYATQPETRGRIRTARRWHPLLFVDAHEMGAQSTFLFSPPRDPVNPHYPEYTEEWVGRFAEAQAKAFDDRGWRYYTGEWNEGWYPGYSNAWAGFRGAVGMLYEQSHIGEDAVRKDNDRLETYGESVLHQAASSLSNLRTLADNRATLLREYLDAKRKAVAADGPYAERLFALPPTENEGRLDAFVDLMRLQGFELYETTEPVRVGAATDQLGRELGRHTLPAGTLLIPNRQPQAPLVTTMLGFDPRIPEATLRKERKKLLGEGRSRIYDVTAWNITMYYGLDALSVEADLPSEVRKLDAEDEASGTPALADDALGYLLPGIDDRSVAAAARLMRRGVSLRVADEAGRFGELDYDRGAVLALAADNDGEWRSTVAGVAGELGLRPAAVTTGWGASDRPDLGGRHFVKLERPRVALVSRGQLSAYDVGSIWHLLDERLGLGQTQLEPVDLAQADLRRYNVVILPDRYDGQLSEAALKALEAWTDGGGTLIAVGDSAAGLADPERGISKVRTLPDALDELHPYRLAVARDWLAQREALPPLARIWTHRPDAAPALPWGESGDGKGHPWRSHGDKAVTALEREDEWRRPFMPQGAILSARLDDEHWLTFGDGDYLPVLFGDHPVLMADSKIEAPVRMGRLTESGESEGGDGEEGGSFGWARLPGGPELELRMSGLLWPEAAARIANAAYLTREAKGKGQILLFAAPPNFRGATRATARLLANAVVYGPGFGAGAAIIP